MRAAGEAARGIREIARYVLAPEDLKRTEAHATFDAGTIGGDTRPIVVPEFALAEIGMRADTQSDMERLTVLGC